MSLYGYYIESFFYKMRVVTSEYNIEVYVWRINVTFEQKTICTQL